jgi:DNA modification methylase
LLYFDCLLSNPLIIKRLPIKNKNSAEIDRILNSFINLYKNNQHPIEVSFRDLFPSLNRTDRASHLIHTYPAKLLVHIPYFFLNNNILTKEGDKIFDPFCGSGTVLLEALLANKDSFGSDSNPLARLLSTVKTYRYETNRLYKYIDYFKNIENCESEYPSVVNMDYWFLPKIKVQLIKILNTIKKIEDKHYQDFFLICFSNCIRKVSLADPRVSVPVRIKPSHYPKHHPFRDKNIEILKQLEFIDVKDKFLEIVFENIRRIASQNCLINGNISKIVSDNAKYLINPKTRGFEGLDKESMDLVITSPPYAGAQKYIRASSLSLGWAELASASELKGLDNLSIGRESYVKSEYMDLRSTGIGDADSILQEIYQFNPLRAYIAGNYLIEMEEALKETYSVLKKGGYLVIVAANNQVCKREFKTQEYLQTIVENLGAKVIFRLIDDIKSYGLMTKRNKTASIITREWILVFQKPT